MLDLHSSESPVYGEQEQSAYNGYFGSVCYYLGLLSSPIMEKNDEAIQNSEIIGRRPEPHP